MTAYPRKFPAGVLPAVLAMLVCAPDGAAQEGAALPPDSQYVRATADGHLELDGRRVRYWGFIGHVAAGGARIAPDDSPEVVRQKVAKRRADMDLMSSRIEQMGFNLVRSWEGNYDLPNPRLGGAFSEQHDYQVGDGSVADVTAYYFKKLDERGIKLWMSSTNQLGSVLPEDVGVVDDPATADAWRQAVEAMQAAHKKPLNLRGSPIHAARWFDPRIEALMIRRLRLLADFPNKYKGGLRLGDDPQVAVWEITNEEFPFRVLFNGWWQQMHPFFRNQLIARWNQFLRDKYGDEERLKAAWQFLLPGESLADGTILLAPLASPVSASAAVNDTNPAAAARIKTLEQKYSIDDFNRRRGGDVVEFFTKLMVDHKRRVADAMRTMGRGMKLSPIVFDSGNDFSIQQQYLHSFADAVSTCAYIKNLSHDPTHKRYPFYSGLDESPRLCWDVPWLEQSSLKNKPHFVYETNVGNTTKYRAEYPYRVAALASIQDWDIVCWHVYGGGNDSSRDEPFVPHIDVGHDYLHYKGDATHESAIKTAGAVFRGFHLKPAPAPTEFVFGRRSLYDPQSMTYGKSYGDAGPRFIPTTYRHGSRVSIDPTTEEDKIVGPSVRPNVLESCPVKPNDQIEFDWQKGHLLLDAPGVASYTGFFGQYGKPQVTLSATGTVLSDIRVINDDGMAYPVTPDEQYVAISVVSEDGLPLAQSRRMVVSAVSTSFNDGFRFDMSKGSKGMHQQGPDERGPREFFGGWPIAGKPPVRFARVEVTISNPVLAGLQFSFRDYAMREIGSGVVGADGVLKVPADLPVFVTTLERR